ncbi:hypothetical protein [Knoellia sp. LjRoot47]|uniref:hypothetical protein n=1 Tax=Knoellia sp. LjRoot47 TaxID=3342330 RepID=UPI003ED0A54F
MGAPRWVAEVAWGDVSTWFSGLVTAAALLVSAYAVRYTAKSTRIAAEAARDSAELVRIERGRFAVEVAQRREAQARLVACRLLWREEDWNGGEKARRQYVVVANGSGEPVKDVHVLVAFAPAASLPRPLGLPTDALDVDTAPCVREIPVLEPTMLAGPFEQRIEVALRSGIQVGSVSDGPLLLSWRALPSPFVPDVSAFGSDARREWEAYDRRRRPLGEPAGTTRERYEWLVASLNDGRSRVLGTSFRPTFGASRWSMEFTDSAGIRWRRTPTELTELTELQNPGTEVVQA